MSVGMTVFTTLVGLTFVALALYAFSVFVFGVIFMATGTPQDKSFNFIATFIGAALGTPLACYLAYRWFTIPVTPFTFTIGGRRRY